jgi:hypothetical protein
MRGVVLWVLFSLWVGLTSEALFSLIMDRGFSLLVAVIWGFAWGTLFLLVTAARERRSRSN